MNILTRKLHFSGEKKAQDAETKKQILISQIEAGGGAIKLDQNVPKFQVKTSLSEAICLVNGLCGPPDIK